MSEGLASRILRLVSFVFLLAYLCAGDKCQGEILPRSGDFEGIYHQDRWGVGHFNYFLVAPELHKQLGRFENRRIRLEVLDAFQPVNPGNAIVRKIGKIAELDNSALVPELRVRPIGPNNKPGTVTVELTFFLANQSDKPIEISLQDVVAGIRSPGSQDRNEEPSRFMPEYRIGQLGTKSETLQWLNNHMTVSIGSFEHGHHLRIAPRQTFPLVADYSLEIGAHEISLSGRPFLSTRKRGELSSFTKWFRIDIDKEVEGSRSRTSELSLADVQWSSAKNQWDWPCVRLSFVVTAPPGKDRSIAVCSTSDRSPLAGTLTTSTKAGDRVKVDVDPCYDCSNLGYPWELVRIPGKGITSSLNVSLGRPGKPIELPKSVRLQLLTDQGLESFELEVPPADKLAPAK